MIPGLDLTTHFDDKQEEGVMESGKKKDEKEEGVEDIYSEKDFVR